MHAYPGIVVTATVVFDGVNVQSLHDGAVAAVDKYGGRIYGRELRPNRHATLPLHLVAVEVRSVGERRWLVRGTDDEGAVETWLVFMSDRPCGCGGPRRRAPSESELAELASFDTVTAS